MRVRNFPYPFLSRLHTSKFSLTSFDLANFICWCVKKNLSIFSLTSALVQKLVKENTEIAGAQRSCCCDV